MERAKSAEMLEKLRKKDTQKCYYDGMDTLGNMCHVNHAQFCGLGHESCCVKKSNASVKLTPRPSPESIAGATLSLVAVPVLGKKQR